MQKSTRVNKVLKQVTSLQESYFYNYQAKKNLQSMKALQVLTYV